MKSWVVFVAFGGAVSARAASLPNQSIPERPVVLEDGVASLYGGLGFGLRGRASGTQLADPLAIPLGIDVGMGGVVELGGHMRLTLRPDVETTWSMRMRLRPTSLDWLAVGLEMTLPFGLATPRLGPPGLPLLLELPVVRFERARAALQARVLYEIGFYRGSTPGGRVQQAIGLEALGLARWDRHWVALLEVGSRARALDPDQYRVALAVGVGHRPKPGVWIKIEARTEDLVDFGQWVLLATWVRGWEDPRKEAIDTYPRG